MSALSTAAVATIVAILILSGIAFFMYVFSTNVSYVYSVAQTSANNLKRILGSKLRISSVNYVNGTLCLNLSNEGSISVILDRGSLLLLDYISLSTNSREITLIPYERIKVNRVFLNNKTFVINENTAMELLPGITVELCTEVNDIDTSSRVIVVFSLPIGLKVSHVTYIGD